MFQKAKEQGVCLFYQKGLCKRDACPFKHEMIKGLSAPEAKALANPAPKAGGTTKAAVALVMAPDSRVAGQPTNQAARATLDLIGDTVAGEHFQECLSGSRG